MSPPDHVEPEEILEISLLSSSEEAVSVASPQRAQSPFHLSEAVGEVLANFIQDQPPDIGQFLEAALAAVPRSDLQRLTGPIVLFEERIRDCLTPHRPVPPAPVVNHHHPVVVPPFRPLLVHHSNRQQVPRPQPTPRPQPLPRSSTRSAPPQNRPITPWNPRTSPWASRTTPYPTPLRDIRVQPPRNLCQVQNPRQSPSTQPGPSTSWRPKSRGDGACWR